MDIEVDKTFLGRLKTTMDEKKVKQSDICKLTGISSSQMHHLTSGRTKSPSLSTACKIALALDVSLDYLGGLVDEPCPIRRDKSTKPSFEDKRQERLNAQYEEMNERGQSRAADSVDDIHANPRNLKSDPKTGLSEAM